MTAQTVVDPQLVRPFRITVAVARFPELSQTFILDQIAALKRAGFDVEIVAIRRSVSGVRHQAGRALLKHAIFTDRHPAARLLRLPLVPTRMREIGQRLIRERLWRSAAVRSDLVICHFGPVGLYVARAVESVATAAPIWTIFHGYDLSSYIEETDQQIYEPLFRTGERFLPISRLWASKLEELGCPSDRIQLLRMGVDCNAIPFVPADWSAGETIRILQVGRLVEKKGAEYSIRALARVARSAPQLDWQLDIAGDGPLRDALRQLIGELDLGRRVSLLGPLSSMEVRDRLRRSHLFLLPSVVAADGDMEGIPVSLMEAMAAGVPVVSTFHSGIPELVEHEVSGLLAPERDIEGLALHLERLTSNAEERRAFAEAARRKVEREFNQEQINGELVRLIRTAIAPSVVAEKPRLTMR